MFRVFIDKLYAVALKIVCYMFGHPSAYVKKLWEAPNTINVLVCSRCKQKVEYRTSVKRNKKTNKNEYTSRYITYKS